jgi:threonine aldolase
MPGRRAHVPTCSGPGTSRSAPRLVPSVRDRVTAVIDLRSDTATRPTDGMRAAIAAADVGDEQRREDPTVTLLQDRAAKLLGQEAAVFLPTATMANQIALKLHARPGDVLVADRFAHVVIYEAPRPTRG